MTQPIKVAFEAQGRIVPIDAILPTRSVSPLTRKSRKYLRIRASIQEVGIVEPIVVHPQSARGKSAQYLLRTFAHDHGSCPKHFPPKNSESRFHVSSITRHG